MTWEDIAAEIERQGEIESLWRSLASYNVDDYPELSARLGERTVNLGRRAGYTTYIVNNCRNNDVIVSVNNNQNIKMQLLIGALRKSCIYSIIDNTYILRGKMNLKPHTVWFNDYSSYHLTHKRAVAEFLTCLRCATDPLHYFRIMRLG